MVSKCVHFGLTSVSLFVQFYFALKYCSAGCDCKCLDELEYSKSCFQIEQPVEKCFVHILDINRVS